MSELDDIRSKRAALENRIGALLRDFEQETGVEIRDLTFGPVEVVPVGGHPTGAVQDRRYCECLIYLSV